MAITWQTGPFSARAWDAVAPILERIDRLPLLVELADGTLAEGSFVEYIVQDDFYLRGYSRALAMLATRAPTPEASAFWARSAGTAAMAEMQAHAALLNDPLLAGVPHAASPSPTTRLYVNTLQTSAAYDPYPVGVAAVLPCYWVYGDVGARLAAEASVVEGHPYAAWVATYADPGFLAVVQEAISLLDAAASDSDEATRTRMLEAFVDATRCEELFWERSYVREAWSV